jgi:hypothetical protein
MSEYLKTLKPFCKTARQEEILAAVIETDGNMKQASLNLGINKSGAHKVVKAIRKNASKQGYAPEYDLLHPVADTQILKGASTLYGADGEVKLQWIKSSASAELIAETLQTIADELNKTIKPVNILTTKSVCDSQLLTLHTIADYHLGMFSSKALGGVEWSTPRAEQFLLSWFQHTLDNAPEAETGFLLFLGDFMHFDSLSPVTPASKHVVDADIKYNDLVPLAIRLVKQMVLIASQKYKKLVINIVPGNHDEASMVWLREFLVHYYSESLSIEVMPEQKLYSCYVHGKTSLFMHHGHKRGLNNLDETLIGTFRKEFGQTDYSYAHIGHYHHKQVKESSSIVLEMHRTLAPKDSYSSNGGWLSERTSDTITYHKQLGEVSRFTTNAKLIESLME